MDALLEVKRLVKRFPISGSKATVWAVNDVSFAIRRGETYGLVGESGSGKTTVGRCVLRLIEPTSGEILFDGKDILRFRGNDLRRLRTRIQIVFQEPFDSMDPRMMLGDVIREPLQMAGGMSTAQQMKRVMDLVNQVAVAEQDLDRYPHESSGGELQKVGLARAMATRPDLIVLDEPTSLLDPSARADILDVLQSLQKETGVSFLFISHDLATVRHISHRVAVMYLGKIVEMGTTQQIFETPLHPYTKALLSAVLYPDPNGLRSPLTLRGEIPSPIDLPSGCFLHPRCPVATEECGKIRPQLADAGGNHYVACLRVPESDGQRLEEVQVAK